MFQFITDYVITVYLFELSVLSIFVIIIIIIIIITQIALQPVSLEFTDIFRCDETIFFHIISILFDAFPLSSKTLCSAAFFCWFCLFKGLPLWFGERFEKIFPILFFQYWSDLKESFFHRQYFFIWFLWLVLLLNDYIKFNEFIHWD